MYYFQFSKILLADLESNPGDRNDIHRWFSFKLIGEQTSELDIQQIKDMLGKLILIKLRCDCRFQRAFTACSCVFKVIILIGTNQGNYFEK